MADEPVSEKKPIEKKPIEKKPIEKKPIEAAASPNPTGWLSRFFGNPTTMIGAVLLIAAIAIGVVVMLGRGSSGGSGGKDLIADIPEEPDDEWKYTFTSSDDEFVLGTPVVVSVTDDTALIWPDYDWEWFMYSQEGSYNWYEGYDEDYDTGYDAGLLYQIAYDEWWASDWDSDIPYPEYEDYYPAGTTDYPANGWWDGFNDATYGYERGASAATEPEEPDFSSEVTLLDLRTGDSIWDLDVVDEIDDFDYSSGLSALPVTGTDFIVFMAQTGDPDSYEPTSTLISVNASSGEIVSDAEYDGYVETATLNGGLFVLSGDEGDQTVARLNPADLTGDPLWESDAEDARYLTTTGQFLVATDYDTSYVFELESGDEANWGDDIDYDTSYAFIEGQLIRVEWDEDTYEAEIVGQTIEGDETWEEPVDAEWAYITNMYTRNSTEVILVADETSDGYDRLQRLNPRTGEPMWKKPYRDEIAWVEEVFSGIVLASEVDGDRIVAISLSTGEEVFSKRVSGYPTGFWPGRSLAYMSNDEGELTAYLIADGDEAWTYDFDDEDESIMSIGTHLFLVNGDKHTISLLK